MRRRWSGHRRFALSGVSVAAGKFTVPGYSVAMVAQRQLVALLQTTFDNANTVNTYAVGAVQVPDHEVVLHLGDTAVPSRDFSRIDLDVALGMPAEQQDRLVQQNAGAFVQGHELRDSPINRDSGVLANQNVWIDVRDLTLVPAGTGGYASERYYTAGGLLEVGGYLANTGHTIGEWTAVGGS